MSKFLIRESVTIALLFSALMAFMAGTMPNLFHSTLLVVLGHQKCGAVAAACSGDKMLSHNLQAIVDKIDPAVSLAKTHAKSDGKPDDLIESAIKENVHRSAEDVLANSEILRAAVRAGKLTVVEAEYELDSGAVVRLNPPASSQN